MNGIVDGARELTDAETLKVVAKEAKKRKEAIEAYQGAGREDLAAKESAELVVLEAYLPAQLSDEEIDAARTGGFATGNADDLYRIRHQIADENADVTVVLSADQVFTLDLRDVVAAHLAKGADLTIVTTEVPVTEASNKAVVTSDATGKVTRIDEKPEDPDLRFDTTGADTDELAQRVIALLVERGILEE